MAPSYDFASLERFVIARYGLRNGANDVGLAAIISMADRSSWIRSQQAGRLSSWVADRLAVTFGVHPSVIWPSWFEDALEEPFCAWCRGPVNWRNSLSIYCSADCRQEREREQRFDRRRQEAAWERIQRVSRRVMAMSACELAAFLGIESEAEEVAA